MIRVFDSARPVGHTTPHRTRTCNLRFRRPMLYPFELAARFVATGALRSEHGSPVLHIASSRSRPCPIRNRRSAFPGWSLTVELARVFKRDRPTSASKQHPLVIRYSPFDVRGLWLRPKAPRGLWGDILTSGRVQTRENQAIFGQTRKRRNFEAGSIVP